MPQREAVLKKMEDSPLADAQGQMLQIEGNNILKELLKPPPLAALATYFAYSSF